MTTLNELNSLRVIAGMKPLKVWKASKAALAEAIKKLQANTTATQQLKASVDAAKAEVVAVNKEIKKAKGDHMTIADIASKLNIDAKVARAKLRRHGDVASVEGDRWLFTESQAKAIIEILSSDRRKK